MPRRRAMTPCRHDDAIADAAAEPMPPPMPPPIMMIRFIFDAADELRCAEAKRRDAADATSDARRRALPPHDAAEPPSAAMILRRRRRRAIIYEPPLMPMIRRRHDAAADDAEPSCRAEMPSANEPTPAPPRLSESRRASAAERAMPRCADISEPPPLRCRAEAAAADTPMPPPSLLFADAAAPR